MKLSINVNRKKGKIEPEIYGHFSEHLGRCIYGGLFVGKDSGIPNENGMRRDVVKALREIKIPVLRWPGGCFADEYHWKDGIGPKEQRGRMVNTHWGGDVEDNSFGTHEFFELCRQLGCKAYVCGNVGSGTVQEMNEWVEYMTTEGDSTMGRLRRANGQDKPWRLDYFGVGNENWGCGGNMTPDFYAGLYRRYQTYVRTYNREAPVKKVCGGANAEDYNWTEKVFAGCFESPAPKEAHGFMDGYSLHYYCGAEKGAHKGSAVDFTPEEYWYTMNRAMGMDELIRRHGEIMDQYDPEKKIGMVVDEWGCWHDVEIGTNPGYLYQQNTMRDALVAALTLNIFNRHCDRVKMACIAQIVNVLQAVILTEGASMVLTPTYYVFHMYRYHQGAQLLESSLDETVMTGNGTYQMEKIGQSVSVDEEGVITATLTNIDPEEEEELEILLSQEKIASVWGVILHGQVHSHNTFETPFTVKEEEITDIEYKGSSIKVKLPPCSVVTLRITLEVAGE